ncbi:MAG: ferritin [Chloroflexota bacterium]|nr:ferritin [Chloroflexota bacterium]
MLTKSLEDLMNDQIANEMFASNQYLAMSAYFEDLSLPGFARWFRLQAEEEREHAMKFYDFIHDRNGRTRLQAIGQPLIEFGSPLGVFEKALAHEQKVTAQINNIYATAVRENDFASQAFLNWFVTEQVEEEKNAQQLIDTLRLIGDRGDALVMLDRELGAREPGQEQDGAES